MRLFGPTLRHSISANGGESTELSVATHANRSQQSDLNWEPPIIVTSGRTSKRASKQLDLFGASLRMSPIICHSDSMSSPRAYTAWVSKLRHHLSELRTWAHDTKETGYSYWPTPLARDLKGTVTNESLVRTDGKNRLDTLDQVAVRWDITRLALPTVDGMEFRSDYIHRRLNPNFTDWMMGWDENWTSVEPTDSGSQETE